MPWMDRAWRYVLVWDGWVRLFHWSLLLLLLLSWGSAKSGAWKLHFFSGYAILTLVLFRIAWGLFGSESARFGRFLASPFKALAHLREARHAGPDLHTTHNPAGADTCASVFFDDFDPAGSRILVVGCLQGRDPREMLSALRADEFDVVLTCTAPSSRGMPASELTVAARSMGCDQVLEQATVEQAIDRALALAESDDAILITGSLYVVGGARPYLRKVL